jgi:ABC transporter substrate binding protein
LTVSLTKPSLTISKIFDPTERSSVPSSAASILALNITTSPPTARRVPEHGIVLTTNRIRVPWRRARDYRPCTVVEAGGLTSYGPNFPDLFRRAAELVDKILRGVKPANLPVEQPTKFDLIINSTTAKALGLQIPDSLLALADEVIE